MKITIKRFFISLMLAIAIVMAVPGALPAQPPPPPDDPTKDEGNQPVPIGSGLVILIALAGGYGVVTLTKRKREE